MARGLRFRLKRRTPLTPGKRRLRRVLLALVAVPISVFFAIVFDIQASARGLLYTDASKVPSAPVAIVLGAGFGPKGEPSLILAGRLDGAIELYKSGKVGKLLMSGDNRTIYHNEPAVMRRYAISKGVPSACIEMDFAGRDTYDTCYRAKHLFGIDKAVIITQRFHAARALYIARAMDIDAVAYGVPNLDAYPLLQMNYTSREYLADVKACWDVHISHRKPYVDQQIAMRSVKG